ncbi:hypothetical protein COT47_04855 [Candidatus Woesearchaeota archaeon CG08_land_8_20_14_0_20_43_7]|nr:MAG: hypothetical protein COT47_04855 [Candidatus Woesearchaeota archaeon CG08_land_8_20_14_0_20_43_7]
MQNIFLQKLVSEEVLDSRVILTSEEYFKGIVFVDYLVDTVLCDKSLLSDLFDIAKWLEAHDEKLDPDLKLFALYGAITFKRIHSDKKKRKSLGDETRYNEVNEAVDGEYLDYRRIDPMYESLGCMVYDLVEDAEMKRELDNIEGVSDLKAVVFIDSLMPLLAEEDRSVIHGIMASGGYYKASMYAMKSLADRTDGKDVKDYVAELRQSVA